MKVDESLNITLDESPPPCKTSLLVDDELVKSQVTENEVDIVDLEENRLLNNDIVNIKESKNHPLDKVIGKLNERTLRSQVQNQSNFFYFVSTIKPKNVNEAIKDESCVITMLEELNQFVAKMFGI
ncbi:hypothetical protein Tco_0612735 [Tanacetum coccineum]